LTTAVPKAFLADLAAAGIAAGVETEITEFEFADFAAAWEVLAGVTGAALAAEPLLAARASVRALMWPDGDGPRRFRNETLFILGRRAG
jgi:hypothetical protein